MRSWERNLHGCAELNRMRSEQIARDVQTGEKQIATQPGPEKDAAEISAKAARHLRNRA